MLKTNLTQILKLTKNNVYSNALTNYIYHQTKNKDLKWYFGLLKRSVEGIPQLSEFDIVLKKCQNVGIKYLVLKLKLAAARFRREETICKKLYKKLLKEYDQIPVSCRKAVARELKIHSAYHRANKLKEFRTWSEKHLEDAYDKTFDTLQNTLKLFSLKDESLADGFYRTFQEALKHQQQNFLFPALNNAAWQMKTIDLKKAIKMAAELGYYLGYYAEISQDILSNLDTQLNIARLNVDYESFYAFATLYEDCYERYAKPFEWNRQTYRSGIQSVRREALVHKKNTLKRDEIANGKALRYFLREQIGKPNTFAGKHGISHASLYRILNGERKKIKIQTLKRIVKALKLDYSFKHPRDINYVLWVLNEETLYNVNRAEIHQMSDESFELFLLRGIFLSSPDENLVYRQLFSLTKDRETFLEFTDKRFSAKVFVNRVFKSAFGFYRGRMELLETLMVLIGMPSAANKLMEIYGSLKTNEEFELLNRYFRYYTWGKTISVDFDLADALATRFSDRRYESIYRFCEKIKLSELDGYLCTWFFEEEARKKLFIIFDLVAKR